jgi:hypothetical protein
MSLHPFLALDHVIREYHDDLRIEFCAAGVRHLLNRLIDEGSAVQEEQRRGTKYRYIGRG